MCTKTTQWVNTHGWTNIFTFPDSTRAWVNGGSPRYYVYSAIDSSLVYQGPSSGTARNMALAQSTVGIDESLIENSKFIYNSGNLIISEIDASAKSIQIYSISGQLM